MNYTADARAAKAFRRLLAICHRLDAEWRDVEQAEGYKLGFYNPITYTIGLFNVLNTPANLERLRKELNKAETTYRLVVLDAKEYRSNIHLLDIGL